MKILISAAETSSDAHGAELLRAIRSKLPPSEPLEAFGIGGPKLQAAGLKAIVDARELLAMGFVEILGHLPRIFKALRQITEAAAQMKPDVAVVIDYPDFHFRLARRLKKLQIPIVYYIPPKVWVWRKGRVELLKKFFTRILCIFPFEESFYKEFNIPVKYVGNPLVDELPLDLTRVDARKKLKISESDRVLILMTGSRASELKRHLHLMLESAQTAAENLRKSGFLKESEFLKILMPFAVTAQLEKLQAQVNTQVQEWKSAGKNGVDVQVFHGNAAECLVAADAGLIKSGTSTLEAGMLRCPHSIVYKPSQTTAWIFKHLIRYSGPVGLVNLVAGWKPGQNYLVREILCEEVTQESLVEEIVSLMRDEKKRQKMIQGFENLRKQVCENLGNLSPSQIAAQEVIGVVKDLQSRRS